ncbi:hypothetical protein BDV23DRAFT_144420, partial [Aspergillus alliaceus]
MSNQQVFEALRKIEKQQGDFVRRNMLYQLQQPYSKDAYYSADKLREILSIFFLADVDTDGHVSLQELAKVYNGDNQPKGWVFESLFNQADAYKDRRLNLAEFFVIAFLAGERQYGYPQATRLKA